MSDITSVDFGIQQKYKPALSIDFDITSQCNLDCSYCRVHNNDVPHPDFDQLIKNLHFAFKYADLVNSVKKPHERRVNLNILGGETLIFPKIVDFLLYATALHNSQYKNKWSLSICVMTNGVVNHKTITKCVNLVNSWTVSYHTETTKTQKKISIKNIKFLHSVNKLMSVRVMAHSDPDKFAECVELANELKRLGIPHEFKVIGTNQFFKQGEVVSKSKYVHSYSNSQVKVINTYWNLPSLSSGVIAKEGFSCCNERPMSVNNYYKKSVTVFPSTNFNNWYCSANWYFLYVKSSGVVYTGTACHVTPSGSVGSLGSSNDHDSIIELLSNQIRERCAPVYRCPKNVCGCGLCAPKAKEKIDFDTVIKHHLDTTYLKY